MARSIDSTDSTPYLTNGSISTCEDIEGGYSSQEDDSSNHAEEKLIVPKCIMLGSYSRRLSQCENMPTRRYSRPEEITATDSRQEPSLYRQCLKRQSVNDGAPKLKPQTIIAGIILFVFTISITYVSQHTKVQSLSEQVNVLHQARRLVEESHGKLTQELKTKSHDLAQYRSSHEKMKKINHDMTEHMRRLKEEQKEVKPSEPDRRAEQAEGRLQTIVDSIRSSASAQVLEKYGPGPHQVELDVKLPGHQDFQTITLDLASIDTTDGMPHAVHTFLEQVSAKAWDGASFGFHAGHVLLAVPSQTYNSKAVPTVLFPEYSNAYQHEEYTVAFPGRPGTGQDFYINVRDNVMNHAPRVQDGKWIEGEPCFARIVDKKSRRVIDEMDKIPVNNNGSLKNHVIIHEARIVSTAQS
jgi:hypothetical protein